jgi:hypothetical protein
LVLHHLQQTTQPTTTQAPTPTTNTNTHKRACKHVYGVVPCVAVVVVGVELLVFGDVVVGCITPPTTKNTTNNNTNTSTNNQHQHPQASM